MTVGAAVVMRASHRAARVTAALAAALTSLQRDIRDSMSLSRPKLRRGHVVYVRHGGR